MSISFYRPDPDLHKDDDSPAADSVLVDLHATQLILQRAEDELRTFHDGGNAVIRRHRGRALVDLEQARTKLASILQRVEAAQ